MNSYRNIKVDLYTKGAGCVQCTQLERLLKREGLVEEVLGQLVAKHPNLELNVIDLLEMTPAEVELVKADTAAASAPIMVISDADGNRVDVVAGFIPAKVHHLRDHLNELAAANG